MISLQCLFEFGEEQQQCDGIAAVITSPNCRLRSVSTTTIMQKQPSSMVSRIVVGVTAFLMFGAAIGMFVF
jgi:hypothetical protein